LKEGIKTLVQCDFDGTVTEEDASFLILDTFSVSNWRQLFKDYQQGKITVGQFNEATFSKVEANRETLLEIVRRDTKIRPGFPELVNLCRQNDFRFVIVSNGLDFYIEDILNRLGLPDVEAYAAETHFSPDGLSVQYTGPDGKLLESNFKLAYVDSFLKEGYRIIYIGDGHSDLSPAEKCSHVFATGTLLELCQEAKLSYTSFTDFNDIVSVLESW